MILRVNSRRNHALLLLCLLAVAALGLDAWQRAAQRAGGRMWLDSVICETASPLQAALLSLSSRVQATWAAAVRANELTRQNARLSVRVAELEGRLASLQEGLAEVDRERALRAAYAGVRRAEQMAHVIGVGSGGWITYLVIDRGRADGARVRDVVVTREGLVGQVYAVAEHSARVLPITDPTSGVSVRVQRTRESGVLKGADAWRCELLYLGPQAQLRAGDELLTAGVGGVFPKGLRVGKVVSVGSDANTSGKMAAVAPVAKLQNVEEVLLLRAAREE